MQWVDTYACCRRMPGAAEDIKWRQVRVFSVAQKMFCMYFSRDGQVERASFKVDSHRFLELTDRPGIIPAPYLARAGWVSIRDPAVLPAQELEGLIVRSHELVVARLPRRLRASLPTAP